MIRGEQIPMLKAAVEDGRKLILIMQREPSAPKIPVLLYNSWLKTVCSHLATHHSAVLRGLNEVLPLGKSTPDQRESFVRGVEKQISYLDELVRSAEASADQKEKTS
jgi:hypothetical protein